mgnify:CR=1 FL=1
MMVRYRGTTPGNALWGMLEAVQKTAGVEMRMTSAATLAGAIDVPAGRHGGETGDSLIPLCMPARGRPIS